LTLPLPEKKSDLLAIKRELHDILSVIQEA
jgi:hypothetical protein